MRLAGSGALKEGSESETWRRRIAGSKQEGGGFQEHRQGCQGTAHRVLGVNAGNTRVGSGARPGGLGHRAGSAQWGPCTHGQCRESGRSESG